MNILSLGAGVQSSCMALMAAKGELTPMPDCAIFADTGAEPKHVYEQLEFIGKNVPFPVYQVMQGDGLETAIIKSIEGTRFAGAPFFCESPSGGGMLKRQCTYDYKIKPVEQKIRQLNGLSKGERAPKDLAASLWMGISMDEIVRMKPSRTNWIIHRWPLIEAGMYRYDCLRWMTDNGHPEPKKSACYFCPYHDNATWADMKENDPVSFGKALKIDGLIRDGVHGTTQTLYLHRSLKPLEECDFDVNKDQFDMFDNECEGMCGV